MVKIVKYLKVLIGFFSMKCRNLSERVNRVNILDRNMPGETELQRIGLIFGDLVEYKRVNPTLEDKDGCEFQYGTELEFLYYRDNGSWVTGANEVGQNDRTLKYWVDETKVNLYISYLSSSKNKFVKNLVNILREISEARSEDTGEPREKGKYFVGRDFKVDNYNDLPELIKLNMELAKK